MPIMPEPTPTFSCNCLVCNDRRRAEAEAVNALATQPVSTTTQQPATPEPTEEESEPTFTCANCDDEQPEGDERAARIGRNDVSICRSCAESDFFECYQCNTLHERDESASVRLRGYSRRICPDCFSNDFFTCDSCNGNYHNDNYGSDGRCLSCESEENESSRSAIADYSDKPSFRPIGKGPHFYGVELEIECSGDADDKAEKTNDLLGDFCICKDDGSINNGFEICTRPASLDEQLKNWKKFFASVPEGMTSFNTTTCGLHVHCSRKPLTALTIGRILCFMNDRRHHAFVERIAGRPFGYWSQYKDKGLKDGAKSPEERYEAVNLMNRDTIEFRVFKGTLKPASLYKAIEFCDALIHFSQPWSEAQTNGNKPAPSLDEWQRFDTILKSFCTYVEKRKKQWPHLWGFISAKWLGRETKESKAHGYTVNKEEQ